jgi:hypothetical protein
LRLKQPARTHSVLRAPLLAQSTANSHFYLYACHSGIHTKCQCTLEDNNQKGGKLYRWDKTGADTVNLFVSLYLDDYDGKTKSEIWQISPFYNNNKQGFLKTLISTQKCIDLFPCSFSEEGFRMKCLQGIDARQGEGEAHVTIKKTAAGRKNNTNKINKVTPINSTRKIKPLNPRSPPLPDTDYVSSDDENYNFRAQRYYSFNCIRNFRE